MVLNYQHSANGIFNGILTIRCLNIVNNHYVVCFDVFLLGSHILKRS